MAPKEVNPPEGYEVPKGYRLTEETKTKRIQVLLKPSTYEEIAYYVKMLNSLKEEEEKKISMSSFISECVEEYIKSHKQ